MRRRGTSIPRSTSPRRRPRRRSRPTRATSCSSTASGPIRWSRSTRRPFWGRRCSTCRPSTSTCRPKYTPCRVRPEIAGGADCRKGYRKSPRQSYVTPLYAACRSGRLEVVRLLLAHISSHGIGTGKTGPLRIACCNGHVEIVRALLDFGMSPFRKAVSGKSAFDYAHPHPPVARLLRPRILVGVRTCVLGTAAEYPCRNRLRDLVPHIASYVI